MQLLRSPATQCRTAAAPKRVSVALPQRRMSVVRRFKEDDSLASKNVSKGANANTTAGKGIDSDVKVNPLVPAFTRRREAFASRLAMVGFFAATLVELYTPGHMGIIGQLNMWTGLDKGLLTAALTATIAYNTLGALGPWSPTFSEENQRDVQKRPDGPGIQGGQSSGSDNPAGFSAFGFTKRNEIFVGRLAMLGIVAGIIQEFRLGGLGPFGQVATYIGKTPDSAYYATCSGGLWISIVAILALAVFFPSQFQNPQNKEDEIY